MRWLKRERQPKPHEQVLARLDEIQARLERVGLQPVAADPEDRPFNIAQEEWVPGCVSLPEPGNGRAHFIEAVHVAMNRQHMGLLTIVAEGKVIFRRYVHTERDLAFTPPFEIGSAFSVWMNSGPAPIEEHSISCCFTVRGRTKPVG